MKLLLSVILLLCFQAHGFIAAIPSLSQSSTELLSSTATVNVAERPKQGNFPESEILQSILDPAKETTYHSLSDLRSYRSWDFSWPTITKPHRFTDRHTYASDAAFFATIQSHNGGTTLDLLTAVGALDEDNSVVLYGGAMVDIITKREQSIRDWDFRLVGDEYVKSPERCVEAARQFTRNIITYLKRENDRIQIANMEKRSKGQPNSAGESQFDIQQLQVTRYQSTITVIVPGKGWKTEKTTLQFTFAPHATVEELLRACYPHCTRVALKNNAVILDAAAKYCIESLCVVLDTACFKGCHLTEETKTKSTSSFSGQIIKNLKYFDQKGFDIILPKLDMRKLPRRNLEFGVNEVLDLPNMTVIFNKVEDNKVMAIDVRSPKTSHRIQQSGRHGYHDIANFEFDAAKFIHHNIRCLVSNIYDHFVFWAEGEVLDPVFDYKPLVTHRMIDKAYETIKKNNLSSGTVNVNQVQGYFSATPPHEFLNQILIDGLESKREATETGSFPEPFEFDEKLIDALISKEKDALERKLSSIDDTLKDKGLANILMDYHDDSPGDISPTHMNDVLEALYGKYLLRQED